MALLDLLATLDAPRREAFVLTQLAGLPYADAAAAVDCPIGTVRSRVARARERVRRAARRGGPRGLTAPPPPSSSPGALYARRSAGAVPDPPPPPPSPPAATLAATGASHVRKRSPPRPPRSRYSASTRPRQCYGTRPRHHSTRARFRERHAAGFHQTARDALPPPSSSPGALRARRRRGRPSAPATCPLRSSAATTGPSHVRKRSPPRPPRSHCSASTRPRPCCETRLPPPQHSRPLP